MSIEHQASTAQRMCEMAYLDRLQTTVIARSDLSAVAQRAKAEATKQSIFAAPWIASRSLSSGAAPPTPTSSSAKADDPVRRAVSALSQAAAITGCPACAGHDGCFVGSKTLPLPPAAHEIEIAAFVGLQDGLVEQMRVAAPGPLRRRHGRKRRAAFFQFLGIDQNIDRSLGDIEPDHVAVLDQRQRTADSGFRRDVQH